MLIRNRYGFHSLKHYLFFCFLFFFSFLGKKTFTYRGCGWKSAGHEMRSWTGAMKTWVQVINNLFEQMFGSDFLTYCYDKDHGTRVEDTVTSSILEYCHDH